MLKEISQQKFIVIEDQLRELSNLAFVSMVTKFTVASKKSTT